MCKWAKEGGGQKERGGVYERRRMNLMRCSREVWQTRHLFESRLPQQQNSSIIQCLQHSWIRSGHEEAEAQGIHINTSSMPSIWSLEYFIGFASQRISSLFLLILFSSSITLSTVLILRGIYAKGQRGLNKKSAPVSAGQTLVPAGDSRGILHIMQIIYKGFFLSSPPVERSQGSFWIRSVLMTTCAPDMSLACSFF